MVERTRLKMSSSFVLIYLFLFIFLLKGVGPFKLLILWQIGVKKEIHIHPVSKFTKHFKWTWFMSVHKKLSTLFLLLLFLLFSFSTSNFFAVNPFSKDERWRRSREKKEKLRIFSTNKLISSFNILTFIIRFLCQTIFTFILF